MKLVTVIGARPQFIKAATVSRVVRATGGVQEVLVHTGQHYDAAMSDVFFEELEIPRPAYHLGIGSAPHGAQTGRMLEAIEAVLLEEKPDAVLVYGDTNSTLAGALAAAKLHIPVAHVEAGLRSFNRRMPEEVNRVLTDHASTWLFTPTDTATANLRAEGIEEDDIHQVGDVMVDAALFYGAKAERTSRILETLELQPDGYILATVHRAENTDAPARLAALMDGLAAVAADVPVVLPLHPRTRKALQAQGRYEAAARALRLTEPVGYLDMVLLERHARLIATDSGGVQKEAFFHGVPCVTLRDETEWVELVEAGWNTLCAPTTAAGVADALREGLTRHPTGRPDLYGDGRSAEAVLAVLSREETARSVHPFAATS